MYVYRYICIYTCIYVYILDVKVGTKAPAFTRSFRSLGSFRSFDHFDHSDPSGGRSQIPSIIPINQIFQS